MINEGKKVIDPSQLVDVFSAQEGEIIQLIGGIGQGKTYQATRMALDYLRKGRVVYTNWHLILPEYYDQRESLLHLFFNSVFFRKRYYRIPLGKNWHYYDIDEFGVVDKIAALTDCVVFCDEGQDLFDSYEGTAMSKKKRKSITRTRHLRKTLIIVSQRAQAIAVTARANVNIFYKTEKVQFPFLPPFFKIRQTEEMDNQNFPLWENSKVFYSAFANKKVFNAYNSWYLSNGVPKSQDVYFDAFDLTFSQSIINFFLVLYAKLPLKRWLGISRKRSPSQGVKSESATLKNGERLNTVSIGRRLSEVLPVKQGTQETLPF